MGKSRILKFYFFCTEIFCHPFVSPSVYANLDFAGKSNCGKRECQKPRLAAKMKVGQFIWLWQLFTYTGHNRGTPGTLTTAHPTGFEPVTDAFGEIAHSPLMHWERHSLFV